MSDAAPFHAAIADAPAGARAFWLHTEDAVRLRAALWDIGAAGTAIVLPGRTEYVEKYGRVVGRLCALGLAAVVLDWRGQGLSDRHPGALHLGHVEDFRHYQYDVAALLEHPAVRDLPRPFHMVAHSMGGCIGLRTLLERSDFATAIFTAPMWHLQMRAATRELTSKMTQLATMLGLGQRLMIGGAARPTALAVAFEANPLTSDPMVYAWGAAQITAFPELAIGGPSVQWTRAALEEMARLYVAPAPDMPVLAFLGTDESVVSASVIRSRLEKMKQGDLVMLEGARHEIFMERPGVQAEVWSRIGAFLEDAPGRRGRAAAIHR